MRAAEDYFIVAILGAADRYRKALLGPIKASERFRAALELVARDALRAEFLQSAEQDKLVALILALGEFDHRHDNMTKQRELLDALDMDQLFLRKYMF
jgi:hypothetical protein